MGVSRSPQELARKLTAVAEAVQRSNLEATKEAALAAKRAVLAEAEAAVGPDLRIRYVGKNGTKIGAGYEVEELPDGHARATLKPRGPWPIVEYAIGPHIITSKRARGSKKSRQTVVANGGKLVGPRKAAVFTPFGPRRFVRHPGIKNPKKPWAKGVARVQPRIPEFYRAALTKALGEIL